MNTLLNRLRSTTITGATRLFVATAAVVVFGLVVNGWRTAAPSASDPATLLDPLGDSFVPPPTPLTETAAALGVLLLGAWLFGRLCATVGLPRISGYLLFGVLVGPDALRAVEEAHLDRLELANDLAISLIALTAGGEIVLKELRSQARAMLAIALGAAIFTFAGVTPFVVLARGLLGLGHLEPGADIWLVALLVALFCTATSPAVVIAMLIETRAKGPLSSLSLSVVVLWDLALVILFAVFLSFAGPALADEALPVHGPRRALVETLAVYIGASMLVGAAVGVALATVTRRVGARLPIVILLACLVIALGAEALGLKPLIVALVAGLVMRNAFPRDAAPFFESLEELGLPVYCVFFALAGARLDLHALQTLWAGALALVSVRVIMLWLGAFTGGALARVDRSVSLRIPAAMLPQAGVAVALALIISEQFSHAPFAANFYNLIIVAIGVQQFVGPLVFKWALARSGEIGVASAGAPAPH